MKTILILIAVCFSMLLYGVFTNENNKTIIKSGDARFRFSVKNSGLTETLQFSRGNLTAKFLRMNLKKGDPKTEFSFTISSAYKDKIGSSSSSISYFRDCKLIGGLESFQKMVGGGFCLGGLHEDAYIYKPGTRNVITVVCPKRTFRGCGLDLHDKIGPYRIRVSVSVLKNGPKDWLSIASKVRGFVQKHMIHL